MMVSSNLESLNRWENKNEEERGEEEEEEEEEVVDTERGGVERKRCDVTHLLSFSYPSHTSII